MGVVAVVNPDEESVVEGQTARRNLEELGKPQLGLLPAHVES